MTTSPIVPMDKAQHAAVPALNWEPVPAVAAKLSHTPGGVGGLAAGSKGNSSLTTLKVISAVTVPLGIILLIVSANRDAPSAVSTSAAGVAKFAAETLQMAGSGAVLLLVGVFAVLLSIAVDAVRFQAAK